MRASRRDPRTVGVGPGFRRDSAIMLHEFAHYNFVRQHKTLRVTPAMAAGVSDRLWTLEELVEQTSK